MMMKAIIMVAMMITAVTIMTNDIAKDDGVDDDNDYDNYNYGPCERRKSFAPSPSVARPPSAAAALLGPARRAVGPHSCVNLV